jgi:hypothetical protein
VTILYCSPQGSVHDGMDKYVGEVSSEPGTGVQTSYLNHPGSSYSGSAHLVLGVLGVVCLGSFNSEIGMFMWVQPDFAKEDGARMRGPCLALIAVN